jgi:hypothetical protein
MGDVLLEAHLRGLNPVGYEINPWMRKFSDQKLKSQGVPPEDIPVRPADFWTDITTPETLKHASVVYIFAIYPETIERFKRELLPNITPGTLVVSNGLVIPGLKLVENTEEVYIHQVEASTKSDFEIRDPENKPS